MQYNLDRVYTFKEFAEIYKLEHLNQILERSDRDRRRSHLIELWNQYNIQRMNEIDQEKEDE